MRRFEQICYSDTKNSHHFLDLDNTNERTIYIKPGPNSDELCRDWQSSLKNRLLGYGVNLGLAGYNVSVCRGVIAVEAKDICPINQETFETVRKIAVSTSLQDINRKPIVILARPETGFIGAEIYYNNQPPSLLSYCISLDLWDLNISGIEIDLSLCDSNNIIVVKRNEDELPEMTTFDDVIEIILDTIYRYRTNK